jgi:hypothetical protein
MTLLNATTMKELSDDDNPRPGGLFSGVAGGQFEPTVRLTGSTHTFRCKVMLLSSDIGGALVMIKVARPNADADDPLCVITRAFRSRARFPKSDPHQEDAPAFRSLGAIDDEWEPQFRSLSAEPEDDEVLGTEDDEEEEPAISGLSAAGAEPSQSHGPHVSKARAVAWYRPSAGAPGAFVPSGSGSSRRSNETRTSSSMDVDYYVVAL